MEPLFCPNPRCSHHNDRLQEYNGYWRKIGFHDTLVVGPVQRFRCNACGKTYSERTFSIQYYTKRTIDLKEIHRGLTQGECISAIARHLGCTLESVQNRIDRLGRASIAAQARILEGFTAGEHMVADGFESFDRSQYHPCHHNIIVGKSSQFLYGSTHVTLRRKGRMTASQRSMRSHLEQRWKPPRGGLSAAFRELMKGFLRYWDQTVMEGLQLWTDEHPVYPQAIASLPSLRLAMAEGRFEHRTHPSQAPRGLLNPLFSVNYYDRELRKDLAAFHRESTCFTRNVANGLMRIRLYLIYHNYQKRYRMRPLWLPFSHAQAAGVPAFKIREGMKGYYTDRPFLSKLSLNDEEIKIWMKAHHTPLKERKEYIPKYALAS